MEIQTAMALILSGAIGVSLGFLGGGGSILAVPVLVYVAGIDTREAVGMSLAIVGTTSLFGGILYARMGKVNLRVAAIFGGAGIGGAYFGSRLTHAVSGSTLLLLFAAIMMIVAFSMIFRKNESTPTNGVKHERHFLLTLLAGLGIGILTGFLGIGGGFLVVPALVFFAGLPMHLAIGTSLLVIAINSAAGFAGHLGEGALHLPQTLAFSAASLAGAFAGVRFARHIPAPQLRRIFGIFVMAVALFLIAANYRAFLSTAP